MEWVRLGVYVVVLIIVGYYLKRKNDLLLAEIQSQKSVLESAQRFMDMFDLDKIEKYVQISERTFQREKEEEIKKIIEEYEEKVTKSKDATKFLARELEATVGATIDGILYSPPELRTKVIENMEDSITKEALMKSIDRFKNAPPFGWYSSNYLWRLATVMQTYRLPTEKKEEKKDNNAIVPEGKGGA